MSESQWQKQGATLSHNNACKEFGLTEAEVIEAMKVGKLQYRINYAHGNPYFRLLRNEVGRTARLFAELCGPRDSRQRAYRGLANSS